MAEAALTEWGVFMLMCGACMEVNPSEIQRGNCLAAHRHAGCRSAVGAWHVGSPFGKVNHITLFTVIDDEALFERAVKIAIKEAGCFERPERSSMVGIPVSRVGGLGRK